MGNVDSQRVSEHVSVRVSRVGVPPEIEAALATLTRQQLADRVRRAAGEIDRMKAPRVVLAYEVAVSLLAACWTLATTDALRLECRQMVVSLQGREADPATFDRPSLAGLMARVVRGHQ